MADVHTPKNARSTCRVCAAAAIRQPSWFSSLSSSPNALPVGEGVIGFLGDRILYFQKSESPFSWMAVSGTAVRVAASPPRANEFWETKIEGNRRRDRIVSRGLRSRGWTVIRVWEHDLKRGARAAIRRIQTMRRQLASHTRQPAKPVKPAK